MPRRLLMLIFIYLLMTLLMPLFAFFRYAILTPRHVLMPFSFSIIYAIIIDDASADYDDFRLMPLMIFFIS